jgi:hypothetical protein
MFYRIVLQSHAQQGAALEEVKRQFSSVTGLPAAVTEQLFAAAPTVIKRQVEQADADRISQTLRAVGANVTVEPVFHTPVPVGLDPVTVPGLPMRAAAIELPPPPVAEQAARPSMRRRAVRLAKAVVAAVVLTGAILVAYRYEEALSEARHSPRQVPLVKTPARAADAPPEVPAFKPAHIFGPWRCTDQNTGASTYWVYGEDGALSYYGDDAHYGDKPIARPGLPIAWALEGNRLTWRYEAAPSRTVVLDALVLMQLDYRDAQGDAIRCRRP